MKDIQRYIIDKIIFHITLGSTFDITKNISYNWMISQIFSTINIKILVKHNLVEELPQGKFLTSNHYNCNFDANYYQWYYSCLFNF